MGCVGWSARRRPPRRDRHCRTRSAVSPSTSYEDVYLDMGRAHGARPGGADRAAGRRTGHRLPRPLGSLIQATRVDGSERPRRPGSRSPALSSKLPLSVGYESCSRASRLMYRRCQGVSTARRLNRSRTSWTAAEGGTPSRTAIHAKAVPVRPTPPPHATSTREDKALLCASRRTAHASSSRTGSQRSGHCIQRVSEGISRRGGAPDIITARSGKSFIVLKSRTR